MTELSNPSSGGGGVTDHGALTGLLDDDHTQYTTDAEATTISDTQSAAAVTTHAAAADPHTGYLKESDYNAKGDLISASANDTPSTVTAGANDTILMADSAAVAGLKWVAPATPSTQAFGDAAAEGTGDNFTRGDHKHAMPADPVTAHTGAADPHTGYVLESLLDAKGDLISATADNTPAKLTVGADDTILMADAAAASGLKWVASASPSAVGTAAATGTGDTFTRGDHVHAHEAAHINHDTTWAAKGDLIAATANDTAAVVTVGTDETLLKADSAAAGGVSWTNHVKPTQVTQTGGTAQWGSTATFFRSDAGNAQKAAMYVKALQASGGGASVIPIVGILATSDVTGGTFSGSDHAIAVLGYQQLLSTSIAGAGYYGLEGRVDHSLDAVGNPTGWGVLGLGVANTNGPTNAFQVLYGVEGRVEYGSGVTGTAKQFFIAGKFTVALGLGTAIGVPLAYNIIAGDGSAVGNNFPISLRGYSSLTGNTGEAAFDTSVVDAGAGGAYAYFNATDARLKLGVFMKLSDLAGAAQFAVVNSGGRTILGMSSIGLLTIGSTQAGETAAIDLPAAAATPSAPATGYSRFFRDPADGLLKGIDSLSNISIMENFAPAKLSMDSDDFISGAVGAGPGIGTLAWTSVAGLAGGVTAVAGVQNHPGIINKSTLATTDAGVKAVVHARGTPATGTTILDIANTVTEIVWIVRLNTISTNTNVNYRIGMMTDPTAAQPTDGVYLEKLAADVGLFGVCRNAGTQTRTGAAVVVAAASATTWAAGAWMRVKIRRTNSTTIGFSVNGFAESTINTNVPTGALSAAIQIGNNSSANTFTMDLDYFHVTQSGFTR